MYPALIFSALVAGCGESAVPVQPTPLDVPPTCEVANVAGAPVVALEWSTLRETYLAHDHGASSIAIDYFVSPPAHVDHVMVEFDFDSLTPVDNLLFDDNCPLSIPIGPFVEAVPEGTEDIVAARVVASSAAGGARTGRVFMTTGTSAFDLRTSGLPTGDATNGDWWFVFEPAAGNARLLIAPAVLDRTTFTAHGIPTNQPGIVALIQTRALEIDAATRTIYAPFRFAAEWREFVHGWYGAVLLRQPDGLVELTTVVPPDADVTTIFRLEEHTALDDGAEREVVTLAGVEAPHPIQIACDARAIAIDVLSFVEVTVGVAPDAVTVGPGMSHAFSGNCTPGASAWTLPLLSRSLNGRPGSLLLRRLPVAP